MSITVRPSGDFTHVPINALKNILTYLDPLKILVPSSATENFTCTFSAIRAVSYFWYTIYWEQMGSMESVQQWIPPLAEGMMSLNTAEKSIGPMQSIAYRLKRFFTAETHVQSTYYRHVVNQYRELCQELTMRCDFEKELLRETRAIGFSPLGTSQPQDYATFQKRLEESNLQLSQELSIQDSTPTKTKTLYQKLLTRWPKHCQFPTDLIPEKLPLKLIPASHRIDAIFEHFRTDLIVAGPIPIHSTSTNTRINLIFDHFLHEFISRGLIPAAYPTNSIPADHRADIIRQYFHNDEISTNSIPAHEILTSLTIENSNIYRLFCTSPWQGRELCLHRNNYLKHVGGNISVDHLKISDVESLILCEITAKSGEITGAPNLQKLYLRGLDGTFSISDCPKLKYIFIEGKGELRYTGNYFKPAIECEKPALIKFSYILEGYNRIYKNIYRACKFSFLFIVYCLINFLSGTVLATLLIHLLIFIIEIFAIINPSVIIGMLIIGYIILIIAGYLITVKFSDFLSKF